MTEVQKKPTTVEEQARLRRLGEFFKSYRLAANLTVASVAQSLELSTEVYESYEQGLVSMPLEDVFALTNLLNIAPEIVMDLVHDVYLQGPGSGSQSR